MAELRLNEMQALSMVRVCEECCPACRAAAAAALGEPTLRCGDCGAPLLAELGPCGCHQHAGEPANPASVRYHQLSKGPR